MPGVLAWIVAVERHTPPAGAGSPLDFKAPVSRRALDWAEWLAGQAGVRLLLNVAAAPASDELKRLGALCAGPVVLNAAQAARADGASLHESLRLLTAGPPADVLLLLWIGHGVMRDRQRYLLHQDSRDAANLRSWDVDSLLQHLRSDKAPPLQLGVLDTCAQVLTEQPGHEKLGGAGRALRSQHFYFAATAAAIASLNPFEPTLASVALQSLKGVAWPPQPAAFDADLQPRLAAMPSRPIRLEWTQGSGDLWSSRGASGSDDIGRAELSKQAERSQLSEVFFRHLWLVVA